VEGSKTTDKAHQRLTPLVRVLLAGTGVVLLVVAGVLWFSAPPATVQTKTETTSEKTVAPPTPAKRAASARTTRHTGTVTTQTLNGRADQFAHAQPSGAQGLRSEVVTVALLAAALLLLILAAVPRLPSKVGIGSASAEWPVDPSDVAAASAAVSAEAMTYGLADPLLVSEAARRVVVGVAVQKALAPAEEVAWDDLAVNALYESATDQDQLRVKDETAEGGARTIEGDEKLELEGRLSPDVRGELEHGADEHDAN
jgi:hypothetical protein